MHSFSVLFLVFLYICVCECLLSSKQHSCVWGPLQECRLILSGDSGLPYYYTPLVGAPLVCVSAVVSISAMIDSEHGFCLWATAVCTTCVCVSRTRELSSLLLVTSVRYPLFLWVRHHDMAWCWFVTRSHDVQVIPPWQSLVTLVTFSHSHLNPFIHQMGLVSRSLQTPRMRNIERMNTYWFSMKENNYKSIVKTLA